MTLVLPDASRSEEAARAPLKLVSGDIQLLLHPELGARVGRLMRRQPDGRTFDYLVPLDTTRFDSALWPRAGCFPMLPFTNRFSGNAFAWRGRQVRVAHHLDAGFLHGWGLRRAWRVEESAAAHCVLSLVVEASEAWPWDYEARLDVHLDSDGADFTLSLINRSRESMPAGLGFHPHFPLHGGVRACVDATARWQASGSSSGLPAVRDLPLEPIRLDLCSGGLPGATPTWFCETSRCEAQLSYPAAGRSTRVSSHDARYVVVHSPPAGRYICLEPSSHLAGQMDPAIDIAQPDQPVTLSMRIDTA
ncbi:aldose epimerase family protein [Paraburkholderia elongata]|uniref:Aldose 1-epimerase n=1 Tax=Paraburkholderia elongata TaxID=2675747 RepID=A0A972NRP2_9BURK|nr:hypothetical protein [Paraburkholderia elongata]NPT57188.1 hypothetical protein [Paraburkholderia elongata]